MASRELPALMRDRSELLLAAGRASEALERRCDEGTGPTVTMSRDELREIAEQMQRVTALMTALHLGELNAHNRAKERSAA